jgi:sugar lactone lactonase YvrE
MLVAALGLASLVPVSALPTPTPTVLVTSTEGDNVQQFDQLTGDYLRELIPSGPEGGDLDRPDTLAISPFDGKLYISSGTTLANSAVKKYDPETGAYLGDFVAPGNNLRRPYGIAFAANPPRLFVSSFNTDAILVYDGLTGAYIEQFGSTGTGVSGQFNGPNGLTVGPDGRLFITTQGSVTDQATGVVSFGAPSEVLACELATAACVIFAPQPEPSPESLGFVSLLGVEFTPACLKAAAHPKCELWVSDFANGIRRYSPAGALLETIATDFTGTTRSGNFIGALSFGGGQGAPPRVFSTGFDQGSLEGPLLRYKLNGKPAPAPGGSLAIFSPVSSRLNRAIGVLALPRPTA